MPSSPMMRPPVGKSGPFTTRISSDSVASGLSISFRAALQTSARLWGGMLVAMPTAMPCAPLTSRLGNRAGSTSGSSVDAS
ncbi:MAG: hypothetical protein KatS3mg010_1178 [Acidimicrobiia bacterium]|nr:MAG: hypothetical protein KatS3mg010_1178 [Acidimicrobiia bacterium]